MANVPPDIPFDIAKFIAGTAGAIASLKFVNGTILEKSIMVLGGSALSYYGATPLANWSGLTNSEGFVGFLLGLLGMSAVAKSYEVIQFFDTKAVGVAFVDGLRRLFGLGPNTSPNTSHEANRTLDPKRPLGKDASKKKRRPTWLS